MSIRHIAAFAGGFGSNSSPATKKSGREKRKRKGLSEFEVVLPTKTVLPDSTNTDTVTCSTGSTAPKLDKWGLPVPTEDDVFPALPAGTELVSATANPDQVSQSLLLQTIQDSLKNHLKLDLHRFGPEGIEINPSHGRETMQLRLDRKSTRLNSSHVD